MSSGPQSLVIETHVPGAQDSGLRALDALGEARHARLLHAWSTDCGPLNRIVSLWEGEAILTSDEVDRSLDWLDERRLSRLLATRHIADDALLGAPLLEMRMYAAHHGKCESFVEALLAVLPFRERHSPCAGIWTTRERGRDVIIHLWAYESAQVRTAARAGAAADPEWTRYRAAVRPLLHSMQAMLLVPQMSVP